MQPFLPKRLSRLIWGLAILGLVIPADRLATRGRPAAAPPADSGTSAPTAAPAAAVSPRPGISAEEAARIREQVATAFERMSQQDPFDLLALGDATTVEGIRTRYFAFARKFAPWRFEAPELQSAAPAAEELFAAGAQAFARLCDPREREALRARHQAPPKPAAPPAAPSRAPAVATPLSPPGATHSKSAASFRIETDLLDPELQYKKGRTLKEAERWSQALQQFAFAADCDPQNGAYRAEAAHCRFLLAPTSMGVQALEELREAQRIDPEAITPYLYAGEIATRLGRFEEAETHLRSAARRLGPTDRRALDALRDLTKKRKK